MSDNTTRCPTLVELSDVLSGRCAVDAEAITLHLGSCARCAQLAESLQREGDLERMIRARPPSEIAEQGTMLELMERVREVVARSSESTANAARNVATEHDGRFVPNRAPADQDALSVLMPTDQPDMLGQLGPYRVQQLIGRGGMAAVFLAEDSNLQRHVALKVLMPRRIVDPQQRERFLREARAAAGIKHDNVVTVYQVDVVEGPLGPTPYLAMELLEGETLDQAIHRRRTFSDEDIRQIGEQIVAGLAAAHAGGLIHRDIKPANVFLDSAGGIKLLDFGLALPMESVDGRLTQDGYLIGTPDYMSPEQAGCMPLDPRSDLFSLGSVLYQLATGKLPFTGATTTLQLAALLSTTPRPVRELNPSLSEPLALLIMQLLERSLDARPSSAVEVRERLHTMRLDQSAQSRRLKNLRRNAVLLAALVICCGIIIVIRNRDSSTSKIEAESIESITAANTNPADDAGSGPAALGPFVAHDLDRAWFERVLKLPAVARTKEVQAELKRRNPGMSEPLIFRIASDRIRELMIDSTVLNDIAPLAVLRELQILRILNSKESLPLGLTDLRPLQGLKLDELFLERCPKIADFSPLNGMPLTRLSVFRSSLPNAVWFARQKNIASLNIGGRATAIDLSTLKHLPLVSLEIGSTPISDLSLLSHHRLEMLRLTDTQVSDLTPIQNMPLVRLDIQQTPITNFEPLRPLEHLAFLMADVRTKAQVEILRSLKSLKYCNQRPLDTLDDYLKSPAEIAGALPPPTITPQEHAEWLARVEKLPPEKIGPEVGGELSRRNPGLGSTLQLSGLNGQILDVSTGAGYVHDLGPVVLLKDLQRLRVGYQAAGARRRTLTDIRPLSGLTQLNFVELEFCPYLQDLTPLHDKPIERLSLYGTPLPDLSWISKSPIRFLNVGGRETPLNLSFLIGSQVGLLELNESEIDDLTPLRGLPLQYLSCATTNVADITPLRNMPLNILDITGTLVEDLTPLKTVPSLRTLRCDIRNQEELEFIRSLTWVEEVNGTPRAQLNSLFPRRRPGDAAKVRE